MIVARSKPQQHVVDPSLHLWGPQCPCSLQGSIAKEKLRLQKCVSFLNLSPHSSAMAIGMNSIFFMRVLILSLFRRLYFLCIDN